MCNRTAEGLGGTSEFTGNSQEHPLSHGTMGNMSAVGNPASVDERWEVVHKVAGSASFQRSPRLRGLLIYICERAIQNRPEELREQQIGCGVFGRKPDYNPGEDNIVRVEMRQLRKRLEEYFATEGKNDPYSIVV